MPVRVIDNLYFQANGGYIPQLFDTCGLYVLHVCKNCDTWESATFFLSQMMSFRVKDSACMMQTYRVSGQVSNRS